nr:hypothetical protein [Bacteroidota bacterium]
MNKRTTSLLIALIFSITNVFSFINNSLDIPPTASKQSCDTSLNYEDTSSQQQNLIVLEEAQVNDIPFNTKEIVKQKLNEEQIVEIVLEEEEY